MGKMDSSIPLREKAGAARRPGLSGVAILLSGFSFVLRRLWSNRRVTFCLALGMVSAVALAVTVPLYADAVQHQLLATALSRSTNETGRPAFSFIFHYVGSWHEPIDLETYGPLDTFIRERLPGEIGLPYGGAHEGVTRYVSTGNFELYPDKAVVRSSDRLDLAKFAFVSGIFEHIQIIEGGLPEVSVAEGQPVDVLLPLDMANDLGLQVGQITMLRYSRQGGAPYSVRVRIAGIWTPRDPDEAFWFYPPSFLAKRMLIPEETFIRRVAPGLAHPVDEAVWHLALDGSEVRKGDIAGLLARIDSAQIQVNSLLPHTDLEASPAAALRNYQSNANALTGLLFSFSVPVFGLTLYFMGLVSTMLVHRQRSEIALLRSRGASRRWIAGVYLLEWVALALAALPIGTGMGLLLARLVGQTRSFLDFSAHSDLSFRLSAGVVGYGLLALAVTLIFTLLPAWQAGRFTTVSYKQDRVRSRSRSLLQRTHLDVLLLLLALYGLYILRAEGRLQLLGRSLGTMDPFQNPLLFLLPAFFIVALSLIALRLLPYLLSVLALLAARFPGPVPVLVLRQLSRNAGAQQAPLYLLLLTLSLAGFIASTASTLDASLHDGIYYQVGADLMLRESGEVQGGDEGGAIPDPFSVDPSQTYQANPEKVLWNFLPVSDHLQLPGVQAATRIGRYDGQLTAGGRSTQGRLIGIDRVDFPEVAFFRPDFASEPLIALMNRLALEPEALLVDRHTWENYHLKTGDRVEIAVQLGDVQPIHFIVAGFLDLFPSVYPEDGPFFIANLDYIFEASGGLQPYDIWLRTRPDTDSQTIVTGIQNMGVPVIYAQDSRLTLQEVFNAPNRQGMLGLLSVGFLTSIVLTGIGFLLFSIISFQDRFIQLGVLRALGLSSRQMAATLVLEQCFLILIGLASGTLIALLTSALFIPHLPMTLGSHPGSLPIPIHIAWADIDRVYLSFGAMVFLGVGVTLFSLRRMKVFQAVKMGENV